ncbi:MAG: hypothetical protein GY909_17515 [Oligoflexia bacterium]|jgi:hypothetical protein|nr:hypothetical protein [Bacteroidota bacterium]MCP4914921.1 hypothetical protein [Oligoflexia bacterium]
MNISNYIPKNIQRSYEDTLGYFSNNPKSKLIVFGFVFFMAVFAVSKYSETNNVVYIENKKPVFTEGRILGTQKNSFLKSKEQQLSKTAKKIMASNKALLEKVQKLEKRIEAKS